MTTIAFDGAARSSHNSCVHFVRLQPLSLEFSAPPNPLVVELKAVRDDAEVLCKAFEQLNAPLPESFPKQAVLDIASGLRCLPNGTARGCLRPLTEAQSQLAAIRSEHIIHEGPIDPKAKVPPLYRKEPIDQHFGRLIISVSTALQTAHRLAAEEPEPEKPDERIETPSDATKARLIQASENLENNLNKTRNDFDAIRNHASERADTLRRRLTDVEALNSVGRAEIRLKHVATARLKRIAGTLREYPAIIKQSAKLIKIGADVAEYAHMKWSTFEERLFKVTTDTVREVADDVIHYVENIERLRKPAGGQDSNKRAKPPEPDLDLLEIERMIARGEVPPAEVIPFVTSFEANNLDQAGLVALGHMTALRKLTLEYDFLASDLGPLADLTVLQSLSINGKHFSDLTPLAGLTALQSLRISGNHSSDLAPLASLIALQSLHLSFPKVIDLAPLAGLTALQSLDLSISELGDLTPLASLTVLQSLRLHAMEFGELNPLGDLAALQSLNLQNMQVDDLAPLSCLIALQSLNLERTGVSNLAPLAGLTALQSLNLRETPVSDLAPLAGLTALLSLDLCNTRVSDIAPLAGLTALQSLNLVNTRINDFTPLRNLPCLQEIYGLPANWNGNKIATEPG